MAELLTFSRSDISVMRWMVDRARKDLINERSVREQPEVPPHSPDTYLARTPVSGIDGISGIMPGYADCYVYRLIRVAGVRQIQKVTHLFKRVHNFGGEPIPGDSWVLTHRDKFGDWFIDPSVITESGTGTGTGSETGTGTGTGIESGTGTEPPVVGCPAIPGVEAADLPIEEEPDYVLAYKDGCLVRVAVAQCPADATGTGSGTAAGVGGVTVHSQLEGLAEDDHPQYLTEARGDARYDGIGAADQAIVDHLAESDPHPQYSGSGSVTSVGLALPAIFTVSGSPVTGAGTLTGTLATQAANLIFAGPVSGSATAPTFRAQVVADLPALNGFTDATPAGDDRVPIYDTSAGANRDCSVSSLVGISTPSGAILLFGGATVPTGFLDCDGTAVSRAVLADLFTAIGTTWGAGDGSSTFNLPDMRGRAPIGVGTGASLTARSLAGSGGAETHTITTAESPAHTHGQAAGQAAYNYTGTGTDSHNWSVSGGGNAQATLGLTTASTGGGTAHANMQPWVATKFIIKT